MDVCMDAVMQIEVLRDSVEEAVEIVTDAVQYPDISPQNVDMAKVAAAATNASICEYSY